jgi:hypothetical protein
MRIRGIHCPLSYLVVVVVGRGTLRLETLRFETPYSTHGPPHLRAVALSILFTDIIQNKKIKHGHLPETQREPTRRVSLESQPSYSASL